MAVVVAVVRRGVSSFCRSSQSQLCQCDSVIDSVVLKADRFSADPAPSRAAAEPGSYFWLGTMGERLQSCPNYNSRNDLHCCCILSGRVECISTVQFKEQELYSTSAYHKYSNDQSKGQVSAAKCEISLPP